MIPGRQIKALTKINILMLNQIVASANEIFEMRGKSYRSANVMFDFQQGRKEWRIIDDYSSLLAQININPSNAAASHSRGPPRHYQIIIKSV